MSLVWILMGLSIIAASLYSSFSGLSEWAEKHRKECEEADAAVEAAYLNEAEREG